MIDRLLHDPVMRWALVVWVALAALYVVPGVSAGTLERLGDTYSTLPLWPFAIAAAVLGIGRIQRPWERRVWVYEAASFAALFGIECARIAMKEETFWWSISSDAAYIVYYVFQLFAAVESQRVTRVARLTGRQTAAAITVCVLAFVTVLALALFRPQVHAAGLPSFLLYVTLDAGIVVLFVRASREATDARWRRACRGLALASLLFCAVDFAELLYYREIWAYSSGTVLDLAWTLPAMCYIIAIRVARLDEIQQRPAGVRETAAAGAG